MNSIKSCFAGTATIFACKRIAQSFNENIYELSAIRNEWTPGYAAMLNNRIRTVLETYFIDEQHPYDQEKRNHLNESMMASLKDLGVFRALLKVDFADDKEFQKGCFQLLGYTAYFSDAKNGDHYSLYMLLDTFHQSMSKELKATITSQGMKPEIIERLMSYSEELDDLKRCFDLVNESDELTSEAKEELNAVYSQVKDICRVATAYYQFDPPRRDLFDFYKVMIKLKKLPIPA